MSAREQRRILAELATLKNTVIRLETKVDMNQQPPPTPILGPLGGAVGLIAGTILTYQQLTGKA